jgi:hypothetical protein
MKKVLIGITSALALIGIIGAIEKSKNISNSEVDGEEEYIGENS